MKRMHRLALAAGIAVAVASVGAGSGAWAASPPSPLPFPCPEGMEPMMRRELFFGTARPDAPPVDEAQWQAFVDDEITPRFPDGLTHHPAAGQWRGVDGAVVRERAHVLLIFHAPSPDADAALAEIRGLWTARYDQESVMQVDGIACVGFRAAGRRACAPHSPRAPRRIRPARLRAAFALRSAPPSP